MSNTHTVGFCISNQLAYSSLDTNYKAYMLALLSIQIGYKYVDEIARDSEVAQYPCLITGDSK